VFRIAVGDSFDEFALSRISRQDHRAEIASLHGTMPHVEPQATLLCFGTVAVTALGDEEWTNISLEPDCRGVGLAPNGNGAREHAPSKHPDQDRRCRERWQRNESDVGKTERMAGIHGYPS
jgi:hypothetical protein